MKIKKKEQLKAVKDQSIKEHGNQLVKSNMFVEQDSLDDKLHNSVNFEYLTCHFTANENFKDYIKAALPILI